jgi:predicted nucleic acid-binding protein
MSDLFADTSFYVAMLTATDSFHDRAVKVSAAHSGKIITSEWVLMEVGNFFCQQASRREFVRLMVLLQSSPDLIIQQASHDSFNAGLAMYSARPDKSWSLVDCVSFCIMQDNGIVEAWTTDHHFEQAGFRAILK